MLLQKASHMPSFGGFGLSQGATQEELLDDYPGLERDDIRACIAYAHTVIAGDTLAPVSVTAP